MTEPVKDIVEDLRTRMLAFIFIIRNTPGIEGSMTKAQYKAAFKQIEENTRAAVVAIGLKLARWGMGKGWHNGE